MDGWTVEVNTPVLGSFIGCAGVGRRESKKLGKLKEKFNIVK